MVIGPELLWEVKFWAYMLLQNLHEFILLMQFHLEDKHFREKKYQSFYRATKGLPLIIWETKNNGRKTLWILKEHCPNGNLKYYIFYSLFVEINSWKCYWQCDKRWKFYLLFKNTGRNNQWNHGFKSTSVRMQTFYHHHHSKRNIEFKEVLRR